MIALPIFWQFMILLVVHLIADFVCQTHWQASNKSKSNEALARHVALYTLILCPYALVLFASSWRGLVFVVVNGALHFGTDYFTSRWTARLYAKQDWHNFFVVIGLDQLIHQVTLAATLWLMVAR